MNSRALRDLRGESDYPPPSGEGGDAFVGTLVAERYRVVGKLGEGAQASVYVAKHTLIKRLVALKILSSSMATDRDLVRRFLDEGQVAGTMGHPNIVESLDMGATEDGRPFLVLEYLDGTTVADELHRTGHFDVARAAYVAVQIASALAAAHQRGIVHRDLKPENVFLVDREGRGDHVKVLDFGISKLESRKERGARAGLVVGTPDYMAPEQVTDPASVDARADVFALGAMLYEMLSGRLPLDAENTEDALEAVVRRAPAPLARIRADLPPAIVAVVERAMHKDRTKRTQTIAEMRDALEPFAVASAPKSVSSLPASPLSIPGIPRFSGVQPVAESAPVSGVASVRAPVDASDPPAPSSRALPPPPPSSDRDLSGGADDRASAPPTSGAATISGIEHAVRAEAVAAAAARAAAPPPPSNARRFPVAVLGGIVGALLAGGVVYAVVRPQAAVDVRTAAVAPAGKQAAETAGTAAAGGAGAIARAPETANLAAPAVATATATTEARAAREAASAPAKAPGKTAPSLGNAPPLATARGTAEAPVDAHSAAPASEPSAVVAAHPPASSVGAANAAPLELTAAPTAVTPAPTARGGVVPFGEGMTRPSAISGDEIQYTREAREAKASGVVIARCTIATDGSTHGCRIIKGVPLMDRAVLDALSRHRGTPAMQHGSPVAVEYTYTIRLKAE